MKSQRTECLRYLLTFLAVGLCSCTESTQDAALSRQTGTLEWTDLENGAKRVSFETPYFFGDEVRFDSINGRGVGSIDGMALSPDGSVYYYVVDSEKQLDDGQHVIHGGIYPDEVTLVKKGVQAPEITEE